MPHWDLLLTCKQHTAFSDVECIFHYMPICTEQHFKPQVAEVGQTVSAMLSEEREAEVAQQASAMLSCGVPKIMVLCAVLILLNPGIWSPSHKDTTCVCLFWHHGVALVKSKLLTSTVCQITRMRWMGWSSSLARRLSRSTCVQQASGVHRSYAQLPGGT